MKRGWEIKRLKDEVEFLRGLTYSKKDEVEFSDNIVLRSNNIDLIKNELDFTELKFINPAIDIRESKKVKKGSLLICTANGSKSHLGKVALIDDDYNYAFGGFMGQITPKDKLDSKFLFYLMTSDNYKKFINELSDGANINNLNFTNLGQFEIPLPSLPEQQRIVSILDEAFTAIAKAKANAEQNLKNAKEVFESYLQGVFENKDWETRTLGELSLLITKGSSPKWQGIKYVDEPGILFVTSENVGEGKLLLNERKYVEQKFNIKEKKSILIKGDVLTNIVGASIGRTAIYDIEDVANINQAVCILRCNPKLILNYYLMNLLNSTFLKKILHENEVNTARANLSLGFFSKLIIPCPTIEEQQSIVRQLDALKAETQKLEAVYQKKIDGLEELKKSILQKAFSGELTEEDTAI